MADKDSEPLAEEITVQDVSSASPVQESKNTWPELVGLTAEEAENKIKEDMKPCGVAVIQVLPADSFVTFDYRTDRVRIFVDSAGKVDRPPRIG